MFFQTRMIFFYSSHILFSLSDILVYCRCGSCDMWKPFPFSIIEVKPGMMHLQVVYLNLNEEPVKGKYSSEWQSIQHKIIENNMPLPVVSS